MSLRAQLLVAMLAGCLSACGGVSATPKTRTSSAKTSGIHGVVVDAENGLPISFVTVTAQAMHSKRTFSHATDGDGAFRLENLPPGTYQLAASYGRYMARQTNIPVKRAGSIRLRIRLDMRSGAQPTIVSYKPIPSLAPLKQRAIGNSANGAIQGLVRNAKTKELLPGAVVGATSPMLAEPRLAVVDKRGRYRLPGLPPGTYVISIYYTVIARGNVEVRRGGIQVTRGKATVIDLLLDTEEH